MARKDIPHLIYFPLLIRNKSHLRDLVLRQIMGVASKQAAVIKVPQMHLSIGTCKDNVRRSNDQHRSLCDVRALVKWKVPYLL